MEPLALLRRMLLGMAGVAVCLAMLAVAARAASAPHVVIHGPDEVLRDFCVTVNGVTTLQLPSGASFELVTTTKDPAIANPGDGEFHPYEPAVVRAAIDAVRYPLGDLVADIYILPYPRRIALESAAGPGWIMLSPGVRPLGLELQHAEVTHELGHVVQYRWMPDGDVTSWDSYRALRGIDDPSTFNSTAPHAWRPHEIFAEDFRVLFGGRFANYSGSIENAEITAPTAIHGLDQFMLSLQGPVPSHTIAALVAFPNPSRGALAFRRQGGEPPSSIDVFDLSGRRIVTLAPESSAQGFVWRWDGRDASGHRVNAGVWLARERGASHTTTIVRID